MTATRRRPRVDPRVHARRREVIRARRRRRRRRVVVVGATLIALAGVLALLRSPLLEVAEVEVAGADGARAEQVRQRLRPAVGQPLATVDTGERTAQVSALAWVASVEISRRLPDTLVARVEPRRPVAAVRTDSAHWLVDAEAVVISRAGDDAGGMLRVRGGRAMTAEPGERLRDDTLVEAVAVAARLPAGLADRVAAVAAPRPRALSLELVEGVAVRLGSAERLATKLDTLLVVLDDLAERGGGDLAGIAEIDLRAPDNPTVRRDDARSVTDSPPPLG